LLPDFIYTKESEEYRVKKRLILLLLLLQPLLFATQIKDVASVVGVRENQLIGYGLVVGLAGTGDGTSSQFTRRAIASLLQSVNVKIDAKDVKSKNVAAVVVTAKLPPFARHGDKIDIEVSSIGDAKSIVGGTLLLTPLKGVDGRIYALAQGAIRKGYAGKKSKPYRATVARIYQGALVEREVAYDLHTKREIKLSLKRSDFETAMHVENTLNRLFGQGTAVALDPRTIQLRKPDNMSMVTFLAQVDQAQIAKPDHPKVVIDEKTGTVVAGIDIKIDPVVVSHGDLTLKISPTSNLPSGKGVQSFGDQASVDIRQNVINMKYGQITIANVTRILQRLGAKPADIIAIIETIKRAGAISAELEVI